MRMFSLVMMSPGAGGKKSIVFAIAVAGKARCAAYCGVRGKTTGNIAVSIERVCVDRPAGPMRERPGV